MRTFTVHRLTGPSPAPATVVDVEVDTLAPGGGAERYLDSKAVEEKEVGPGLLGLMPGGSLVSAVYSDTLQHAFCRRSDKQSNVRAHAPRLQAVDRLDAEMGVVLRRLAELRRRRTLLLGFAQAPAEFLEGALASQV